MIADASEPPVLVIGRGRAGTALKEALEASGRRVASVSGRASAAEIGSRSGDAGVAFMAVPDDALGELARQLAGALERAPGPRVFLHLSGALPASVLAPLSATGIAVGSFHPLQTFTGGADDRDAWRGITVAVEGDDLAVAAAERIAIRLGAHPVRIAADAKPLYHLGAALAANGTVGLLAAAISALEAAGFGEAAARAALEPLVMRAAAAAFRDGPRRALTGPVARGDVATLDAHRRAIEAWDEERLALYEALIREQMRLTSGRGV